MHSYPRSPHDTVGEIVYFGRMTDKVRLRAAGALHPDLEANLGAGFDKRCCDFLGVSYAFVRDAVNREAEDTEVLERCFLAGRRPSAEEIEVWNGFMLKRGWRDGASPMLSRRKQESGFTDRTDIVTFFDYIDADEGRALRDW